MKLHLSWLTSLRFPKGQSTCSAGNMVEPERKRADSPFNNLPQRTLATVSACHHTELVSYTCESVLTNHDCKHLAQHSGSQCWKQLLHCFSLSGFGMINSNWPLATPSTQARLVHHGKPKAFCGRHHAHYPLGKLQSRRASHGGKLCVQPSLRLPALGTDWKMNRNFLSILFEDLQSRMDYDVLLVSTTYIV